MGLEARIALWQGIALSLLPVGIAWRGAALRRVIEAIGVSFGRMHYEMDGLRVQLIPGRSTSFLRKWEVDFGLPHRCADAVQTVQTRQSFLQVAGEKRTGTVELLLYYCRLFGFNDVAIRQGVGVDSHKIYVVQTTGALRRARVGDRAGVRLLAADSTNVECFILGLVRFNRRVVFSYVVA